MSKKDVFTTGEAAEICKVSQQTIIRCFDGGQLKGFRVPGSKFRRIPRQALIKFMTDNGIPIDHPAVAGESLARVVIATTDSDFSERLAKALAADTRFAELSSFDNGFDLGMALKERNPHVLLLDKDVPLVSPQQIIDKMEAEGMHETTVATLFRVKLQPTEHILPQSLGRAPEAIVGQLADWCGLVET